MGLLASLIGSTWGEVLESLLGAAGGAMGLPPVQEMLSGAQTRAAGRLPLPENHDLVRGIRTAYLTALDKVTRAHAAHPGLAESSPEERAFAQSARGFLDARLSILRAGRLDFAVVDEAEVRHVLDEMVHPSAIEGYAAMARDARARAEGAALGEVEADAGAPAPPLFRRFFAGDGVGGLGWYETYALFVNEQIKTNERFRSIFLAAELVDIKRLVGAVDRRVESLDRKRADQIAQGFAQAENAAEQRHRELMQAIAHDRGVPVPPLAAVLRRLGEADVPAEAIAARLEAAAERLLALEARLSQPGHDRPETTAARARARHLLDAGDLDGAEAALRDARGALRVLREQTAREEAALLGDEAGIAQLRLDYPAEAALHGEAARLLDFDVEAAWAAWKRAADAMYRHGDEFGDPAALRAAVRAFEDEALPRAPRATRPLDWARTQNNLGTALLTLGERGDNAALAKAVSAYESALLECTCERAPLQWAMTQNNLGNALQTLGERGDDTALARAVAAYETALLERTRERAPLEWAMTQNNLGNALQALGERGDDTALAKAIFAYENALLETTRERAPLRWATIQNNLGIALSTLGQRGDDTALAKAVSAYENALLERTRERAPLKWAGTQNNLGNALLTLGQRGDDTALAGSIAAYENALLERTRERAPLDWARTQENMAETEMALGDRGQGPVLWRVALGRVEAALEEYRPRSRYDTETAERLASALRTRLIPPG